MSITPQSSVDLLTAAHDYAKRGWRIIPLHRVSPDGQFCSCSRGGKCPSAGKHPKNKDWQEAPTLSAADIQATWEIEKAPNLGIATGPDSGIWVLDIDPKSGGMESMQALIAEHGHLPETFVVRTGSGGYHYYFALPDFELRNTSNRVGQGIDTRAAGGQVVAAPSRTGVGVYSVLQDRPVAQAPSWLLEAVRAPQEASETVTAADLPRPEEITPAEWERLNTYAQRAIAGNLERLDAMVAAKTPDPAAYRGEPWNHTTFQVACSLLEIANSTWNAYSVGQAERDVMARAPRDAEFDDYVVRRTFQSAQERVGDKARAVPEDRNAAADALFGSPDVRDESSGPTEAGGGSSPRPAGGLLPEDFFEKGNLKAALLADAVQQEGPLMRGANEEFWSFEGGVWVAAADIVRRRTVRLLGDAFRPSHATTAEEVVKLSLIHI